MLIWLRSWMLRLSIFMPVFSIVLAFFYYWNVLLYPGEHVSKEYVSRLLTQDSPVYYRDGETVMDSVSYDHHRYYVPYDELPSEWKNAIVAMEDKTFWSHYGVEPVLILKAVYRNLRGTFSGGSTLTQQTAKNLYNRDQFQQERVTALKKAIKGGDNPKIRRAIGFSARVWAKLWEALNAMRLESVFSKEEILEFYANQFHVEGTGRGIGIASRYFFNKLPAELTLQECAFIAAIVKGPSNYNPFIKQTEEARMDTLKKATGRYQEVLNQMLAAGYITQSQRDEIYMKEIPFNRGFFRYKHTTLNDVLKKELDSPPIQKALVAANIDNLSTAGVHIVTTVDQEVQKRSEYAMRRHLTRLSAKLKDITSKAPLKRPSGFLPSLNRTPQAYEFYEGIITKTKIKRKRLHQLTIDLGGHTCIVDRKSLKNLDDMMGVSSKELIRRLPEQGRVLVSMRDSNTCDIELDGVLQGGLLATDKGAIVAVVGGRRNLYLNRALASKVQLGSAWKPVIFAAAIQMGWSPTDMLDNYHNAFVFSNSWWFPGASHSWSPPTINMLWTGAYSENRASAWLLYHLSDRLPEEKLKELAISLNLFPAADETPKEYKKRLNSEEMGAIIPSRSWTQTVAFQRAKREVLQVMPEGEEKTNIFSLHHAHPVILRNGYKQVRESRQSYKHNVAALSFNIKEVTESMKSCQAPYSELLSENQKNETSIDILFGLFSGFNEKKIPKGIWWNSEKERIECGRGSGDPLTWEIIASYQLQESITELPPFWIDGKISMETMQTLLDKRSEYAESYRDMDPYDMEFVLHHPDFLRLINLRYMAHLARELGVKTKLPNKLALVLGAIDVSLNEMNQLYAGILNGSMYQLKDWSRPYMIDKIFTADGDLIYQAKPEKKDVVDPLVGAQVANIMHSVFQNGTAKNKVVKLDGYRVPAIGKTGTTTSNIRAAFCGMLPREYAGLWSIEDGIVISSYVGFDQNREMKRNKVQITGSSGALPFWVDTAQAIADRDLIGSLSKEVPWRPQEPLYEQPTKLEYLKYGKLRVEESQNWFYSEDNDYLERNLYRLYVPVNSERTILKKEPFETEDTDLEEEETGD